MAHSNYGLLSNQKTVALLSESGSIDWLWSVDLRKNKSDIFSSYKKSTSEPASWRIAPSGNHRIQRNYISHTNIIETFFKTEHGTVIMTEWIDYWENTLWRKAECVEGEVCLNSKIANLLFTHSHKTHIYSNLIKGKLLLSTSENIIDNINRANLKKGESAIWALGVSVFPDIDQMENSLFRTKRIWAKSISSTKPEKVATDEVVRSELVIKGLTEFDTGILFNVNLPDMQRQSGHGHYKNNKSAFMIRDLNFVFYALGVLDKQQEKEAIHKWAFKVAQQYIKQESELNIDLEHKAKDFFRGTQRARILPILKDNVETVAQIMDLVATPYRRNKDPLPSEEVWGTVIELANELSARWREPGRGFWLSEEKKHYVYSKVVCWSALHKATRIAMRINNSESKALIKVWRSTMKAIKQDTYDNGYDKEGSYFKRDYSSNEVGTTSMLFSRLGFILPSDPVFENNVRQIQKSLNNYGLIRVSDSSEENPVILTVTNIWLFMALLELGAVGEAEIIFSRVLGTTNDLGIFSERLGSEGEPIGRSPDLIAHALILLGIYALDREHNTSMHLLSKRLSDNIVSGFKE